MDQSIQRDSSRREERAKRNFIPPHFPSADGNCHRLLVVNKKLIDIFPDSNKNNISGTICTEELHTYPEELTHLNIKYEAYIHK